MPRDVNGTFTLVAGNPVVSGTPVSSTWANNTLSDIADSITDSLSRNGDGGMLVPFALSDGTVGLPSLTFTSEATLGLYRPSSGILGVAVSGAQVAAFASNGLLLGAADIMTIHGSVVTSQLEINSDTNAIAEIHTHSATAAIGANIYGARSRGTTASPTVVSSGDTLCRVAAVGYDGTDYELGGAIDFIVDGTPGSNDMPGKIVFSTTADGAFALTSRMTIDNAGKVAISAPGSGATLTLSSVAAGSGLVVNNSSATAALTVAAAGNVTIAAPSSGDALSVSAKTNNDVGLRLDVAAATSQNLIGISLNAVPKAFIGVIGTAGSIINGSVQNDSAFRAESANMLFSPDSGTTIALKISSANVVSVNDAGTLREVGYRLLPLNSSPSGNATLDATYSGKVVQYVGSGGHTITGYAAATGVLITVLNGGSGTCTVAPGSGTLYWFNGAGALTTGNRTLAVGAAATLWRPDGTNWYFWGTGIT